MPTAPPRTHPWAYPTAVALAVLVLGAGVVVAALGYGRRPGPQDAVRGYFAALAGADAPQALAFGDVPPGPRILLTSRVLRAQQDNAALRDLQIVSSATSGSRATVRVTYLLQFRHGVQRIDDSVGLHRVSGTWRLDTVATATRLSLLGASARATIVGGPIPSGEVLVFPGAVPVTFDTPNLQTADDAVTFAAPRTTEVVVQVSDAGRAAVGAAIATSLAACFGPDAAPSRRCPQPSERYVPGALRGAVAGRVLQHVLIDVGQDPIGTIQITGTVRVRGTYRRLGFDDRVETGTGTITVPVRGRVYPVAPLRVSWARTP